MTSALDARTDTVRQPILVIDIGGAAIEIGHAIDRRPRGFHSISPTQGLRDGDPADALAAKFRPPVSRRAPGKGR